MIDARRREELGEVLENLMNSALHRFLPFSDLAFEHRKKIDGDVDFFIKENGIVRIAIECKNWGKDPAKDTWIEDEIIPRFEGTPTIVIKEVIGHINLSDEQKERYFNKNGLTYYPLVKQVLPEDEQEIKDLYLEDLVEEMAFLILLQTSKFRDDFVTKARIKILGNNEIIFEIPQGDTKKLNLKNKNQIISRGLGMLTSKYTKIGNRPLDLIWWTIGTDDKANMIFVPRKYMVYSDIVQLIEVAPTYNDYEPSNLTEDYEKWAQKAGIDSERKGLAKFFKVVQWERTD